MNEGLSERDAQTLLGWGPRTVSIVASTTEIQDPYQDVMFEKGDLVLGRGLDTLRQALGAALATALGADPLNPTFGFEGLAIVADESDRFLLRERLRVAVVNVLRSDARIDGIDQVLIGRAEIDAARAGESASPAPKDFGLMEVEVRFRLRGRPERLALGIGSILGSG
ncbi:MAG: hypothetical protein RL885_20505 [Planctomycetota bacterium]